MKKKLKEKKRHASLQFKLSLTFFMVMIISASISITILLLIFNPILKDNAHLQLSNTVRSIQSLEKAKNFTSQDIISIVNDSSYTVTELSKYDKNVTSHSAEIEKNGFVIIEDGILPTASAVTKIRNSYYMISSFSTENTFWIVSLLLIIAFIVCIVIGTLLTTFMGKNILHPIHDLIRATSEVSRGHFNVRVNVPSDKEYGDLARNFNKMAQELSGIETLRGDFISNVSHEFKTPLASIQGFAKLLQDENISEEDRKEYTQVIIDETSRLSKLSSNILKLTKLENQTTIGKKTRFSLDEQIRKIILVLENEWSKKDINLDIDLEEIWYVGNEELMAQIWQNIINNAIKFTPEHGEISVKLFRSEIGIVSKISDNGPDIPKEIIDKIFDKFYQGDHSRATEGNGLGLALVKRVVDLCGGKVYVENLFEGGVCFTVELPFIIQDMM